MRCDLLKLESSLLQLLLQNINGKDVRNANNSRKVSSVIFCILFYAILLDDQSRNDWRAYHQSARYFILAHMDEDFFEAQISAELCRLLTTFWTKTVQDRRTIQFEVGKILGTN